MTYATLLVHLQSGQSNTALLTVAGQFADRFDARVIGIAACQPMMIVSGDGTVCGDVYAEDQRQITVDLETAHAEFQDALSNGKAVLEWRSQITIAGLASYLSVQARSADLIMTGSVPADTFNLSQAADPGSLVMEVGRPVFVVPSNGRPMTFARALVGWKDSRESRRATADALPLLKRTEQVTVLEIAAIDDVDAAKARVEDVVTWLARHGITADARVERSRHDDATHVQTIADEVDADFIVAGAYGHSRLREWMLGGVTRGLLLGGERGVLLSH